MKYEHKCEIVECSRGWYKKGCIDARELEEDIAHYGADGYKLVSVTPISDGGVGTKRLALFFEKTCELC